MPVFQRRTQMISWRSTTSLQSGANVSPDRLYFRRYRNRYRLESRGEQMSEKRKWVKDPTRPPGNVDDREAWCVVLVTF